MPMDQVRTKGNGRRYGRGGSLISSNAQDNQIKKFQITVNSLQKSILERGLGFTQQEKVITADNVAGNKSVSASNTPLKASNVVKYSATSPQVPPRASSKEALLPSGFRQGTPLHGFSKEDTRSASIIRLAGAENVFEKASREGDRPASLEASEKKTSQDFNMNAPVAAAGGRDLGYKTTVGKEGFLAAGRTSQKSFARARRSGGPPLDVFIPQQLRIGGNSKIQQKNNAQLTDAVKKYIKVGNAEHDQQQ